MTGRGHVVVLLDAEHQSPEGHSIANAQARGGAPDTCLTDALAVEQSAVVAALVLQPQASAYVEGEFGMQARNEQLLHDNMACEEGDYKGLHAFPSNITRDALQLQGIALPPF